MRRIRLQPLAFAAFLAAAGLPAFAAPVQMPDTRPRATDEQLRDALQDIRNRHGVPGLAAAVFDRDGVRAFGIGELTPGGNPVTPESRFRSGQVSLLFTGLAVAALVADGSIPADGELRELAPEIDVHNPWSAEHPIRIGDLVSHRAGLGAAHFRDVYTTMPGQPLLAGINSAFRALRVENPPGEQARYSVVGHAIAAYLVEKAAAMPYEDVLARLLFEPLAAQAALGRPDGAHVGDSAGHAGRPARPLDALPLNLPSAGNVWISAQDLGNVGRLLLNRGRFGDRQLLPAAAIDWLESAPPGSPGLVPGRRHGVDVEEFNGWLFYSQTGALPGFLARFAYSPALGRGYVVLLNHGGAGEALAEADALLRGQVVVANAPAPAVVTPVAPSLASLTGWYRNVSPALAPADFYQAWTGFARAALCGRHLCFARLSHLAQIPRLEFFDDTRLRAEGRWRPGWEIRQADESLSLWQRDAQWQRVPGWQVAASLGAAAFVSGGLLLGVILVPVWAWSLLRRRITRYHELVPRLLPLAAVVAVVAFQVLVFTTDYPALGRASTASIAILVTSLAAPLFALLALPAAVAGFFWGLPRRSASTAVYLALSAGLAVIALGMHGLLAFQSWNY